MSKAKKVPNSRPLSFELRLFFNYVRISVGRRARHKLAHKASQKQLSAKYYGQQTEIKQRSVGHLVLQPEDLGDAQIREYAKTQQEAQRTNQTKDVHRAFAKPEHYVHRQ